MCFDVIDDDDDVWWNNAYQYTKACDKCGQWLDSFYDVGDLHVCDICYEEMISKNEGL